MRELNFVAVFVLDFSAGAAVLCMFYMGFMLCCCYFVFLKFWVSFSLVLVQVFCVVFVMLLVFPLLLLTAPESL